jgi:ribose/xylose/arabinose/galactoside ABC-type transport system permease subunit
MIPSYRRLVPEHLPSSLLVLVILFVAFSLLVPRFMTEGNLINVLRIGSILALAACGQMIVLIIGGIEFSMGSSVALVSVVTVLALPELGLPAAFLAGAASAIAIGVINGILVARFNIPAFLVTLGMLMVVHGLASVLIGGMPLDAPPSETFFWLANGSFFGIPTPIVLAGASLITLHLLLSRSVLGRTWYLIGSNPRAALTAGINVTARTFWAYVIAGGFCALAGLTLTSRVASGQPNLFPGLPFETIAACAVGGIPLSGGKGTVLQVLAGVLIIAMLNNIVVLLNLSSALQQLVIAGVMIVAVLAQHDQINLSRALARFRTSRERRV